MPCIKRVKSYDEVPQTENETKLKNLRRVLQFWESRKLGLQYPATATQRFELGNKISDIKSDLIGSGLYESTRT